MYSDNDLRRLLNVAFLVNHGYRISKVCELDDVQMAGEIINLQQKNPDDEIFLERMTVHMINFDGLAFSRLTNEIVERYGFDEAVKRFFFPFFEKIGVFWQVGSIFPAQEHYISNLFRQKLITEIDNLGPGSPDEEIMLFYLHEDEMHELSLLYYSYLARKRGFQIYYLGQNIPMDDLKRLGKMDRIKYVFTVFINSIEAEELEKYLFDLSEIFSNHKVLISGLQLKQHRPKIPAGFSIVESYLDFEKMVRI